MASKKRNNLFSTVKTITNKLQSKLSKKQAQLDKDFAKQDALRLDEYLYEQGQVNSTALAKRRMKERRGFSRLEAEYRSRQTKFAPENATNDALIQPKTAKQPLAAEKSTVRPKLTKLTKQAKIALPLKISKHKFKLQESLLQPLYGILAIFMRPKKLDLTKPAAKVAPLISDERTNKRTQASKRTQLSKLEIANVNQELDATISKFQKQEKQRRLITVFCFSLSLLFLALVIGKVILNQTSSKLQLHILKNGDLEQQFSAFGFVAREERVLYSPVAGEIEAIKAEGSLVAADEEIANIVTSDISEIKRKNDSIEQQISEQILNLLKRGKNMQANQLFAKADAAMLPTLNLLRRDLTLHKLEHLNNYIYTLQPFMQERNFSLRQMNLADPIIDNLRTEQKVLVRDLQQKARIIETPSAGLISYKINPQLIQINTESIQSMSYEQFITYFNEAKPSVSTNGKKVKEQVPVIRLVDTRYQYFLLQVASAKSSDFIVGKDYKLQVAGIGQRVENCTVLRVTPDAGGVLLLLKCDRNVELLLDQVALKAKIIKATKQGLIVPKVALVYEDVNRESTAYVEVLKGGFVEKERVRVLDSNEQYAIIEGLNAKDTVIAENAIVVLNPRQVKTGQQVT